MIDAPEAPDVAARAIARGGVIAFPTDTVYGLGANLWQAPAMAALYALKARPDEKALPVLMAEREDWARVATAAPEAARRLMEAFWPGALTIVLPRRPDVPDAVGPLTDTIAVRVPDHAALRRVLACTGPLASSSANPSGHPSLSDDESVRAALGHGLALLLTGGALPPRPPSTVVVATGPEPIIVRQGAISAEEITRVLT